MKNTLVSANSIAADSAPRQDAVLVGAVVLSFVVCYAGVIASLFEQWMSNDMYAHGILIPFRMFDGCVGILLHDHDSSFLVIW